MAIRLVLQVGTQVSTIWPNVTPSDFVKYQLAYDSVFLSAWLPPDVAPTPVLGIVSSLLFDETQLLGMVTMQEVLRVMHQNVLVVSTDPFLQGELTRVPTAPDIFQGGVGEYTAPPNSYVACWWSTLHDTHGELLLRLGEIWYAAIMERIEIALGSQASKIVPIPAWNGATISNAPERAYLWSRC